MKEFQKVQTFNVKVIVQETGLKPETLRAWERRYGLPNPQRSAGGHRLYSRRDIETVKWLMARQEDGLSISNAVDLWNSLISQERDPLQMPEYSQTAGSSDSYEIGTIENLRNAWVKACMAYNEEAAENILSQAFSLYNPEKVVIQLLGKGLAQIGDGWYQGKISVQQEHFASELAIRRIEALISAAPTPTRPGRILIAAPPEEDHDFILLVLTLLMRRRGRDIIYLGSNVPIQQLGELIQSTQPRLVIQAAQQLHTAANLLEVANFLKQNQVRLAYGGRIFAQSPELRNRIPGYYLGDRLEDAPEVIERVMTTSNHLPVVEAISDEYILALEHYRTHLPAIQTKIWQLLGSEMPNAQLTMANLSVARDIDAALTLGDMRYLGNEIMWVAGLLVNHRIPSQALWRFMQTYREIAAEYLDQRAAPVLSWLEQFQPRTQYD